MTRSIMGRIMLVIRNWLIAMTWHYSSIVLAVPTFFLTQQFDPRWQTPRDTPARHQFRMLS
jgi:hypothetical protein